MRIAYLDCASGISGDMMLGALVDLGVPLSNIQEKIDSLGLPSCQLVTEETKRCGFRANKLSVRHEPEHAHRHLHHITEMIDGSELTPSQQTLAKNIFQRLGEAEAKAHGTTIEKVHFHEVGAVDSIADIVGCSVALDLLNLDKIDCSHVPTGHGFIKIAHGRCSIPAPATAELLKNIPIAASEVSAELTTPTGAAIVSTVVAEFGQLPEMKIEQIGYGAGDRDFKTQANILRVLVGTSAEHDANRDRIVTLETNLDDVSGEVVGHCFARLFAEGALDVFTTSIQMKKNRPGVKLTVLCRPKDVQLMEAILFAETTTLGVRHWNTERQILSRSRRKIETEWGTIEGKSIEMPDGKQRFAPEYESCRQIAESHNLPLRDVMERAVQAGNTR